MDALDVLLVCVRRWYVFLTMVLIAVFAGLGLAKDRVPIYAATGDFAVIYRPAEVLRPGQADPRDANPMAAGGGQLLKQSIVNDLRSARTQDELGASTVQGTAPSATPDGSKFAVLADRNSDTVSIETFGPKRDDALRTVTGVLAASSTKAADIQDRAGAPESGRLTTFITLPTQVIALPPQSKIKLLIGIVAVGVIAGAALSLLFDRMMSRRRARRAAAGVHSLEDGTGPLSRLPRVFRRPVTGRDDDRERLSADEDDDEARGPRAAAAGSPGAVAGKAR